MKPPAFDLRALVLWCLGDLGHEVLRFVLF
jgi:hypothetical protein